MARPVLLLLALLVWTTDATAQRRLTSVGMAAGIDVSESTAATAAFSGSLGIRYGWSWLVLVQRAVADYEAEQPRTGTQRDVSAAGLPVWEPFSGRFVLGAGLALHALSVDRLDGAHERSRELGAVAVAGVRLPVAGPAVSLELLGRGDAFAGQRHLTASFGVRVQPGLSNTLQRGEPMTAPQLAERAAVWNDVLMQLVLLQQDLESFSRIREIETGIELEFELGTVTLYDDVAKAGRVLAAADPPVSITVFAPNAGRVAAAVTAGTFPPERIRLNRSERVFLRVER